jgi:hypothetical protein
MPDNGSAAEDSRRDRHAGIGPQVALDNLRSASRIGVTAAPLLPFSPVLGRLDVIGRPVTIRLGRDRLAPHQDLIDHLLLALGEPVEKVPIPMLDLRKYQIPPFSPTHN